MNRAILPPPLARLLDQAPPQDASELWTSVVVRRSRRNVGPSRVRVLGASAAVVASLAAAAWLLWPHAVHPTGPMNKPGPLLLADHRAVPASVEPVDKYRALALSDGSWVTVGPGAKLDLLESSERVFSLALRRGGASFEVRPHGPRSWRIDCGSITVEVVGTAFKLQRGEHAVEVSVLRGVVLVRGENVPDRVQRLVAGQQLSVTATAEAQPASVAQSASAQDPAAERAAIRERRGAADRAWREAARRAQWTAAFQQLEREGLALELGNVRQIEDLLLLADVARLSGHPRDAIVPLERVVREHGRDPRAALAAFTLGRIRLDALDEPAVAARDIAQALGLGLPRALAEDAQARLVEAYARAGQSNAARRAAEEYRQRFPRGQRALEIDQMSPR